MKRYKALLQKRAELLAESKSILAAAEAASTLTAEQGTRDDAIHAEMAQVDVELAHFKRLHDAERAAVEREIGADAAARRFDPENPWKSVGEFLGAVAHAGMPGGMVDPRLYAAVTGGSANVPGEGGFLIRPTWSDMLLRRGREASKLYGRTTNIPIGPGSDSFEAPYLQATDRSAASTRFGGVQVYRRAEANDVTATKIDQFKKFELRLEDMMGLAYVTERQLQDIVALGAYLEDAFASAMAFKADDELFRGTGAGQCLGALNAPALVTVAKEAGQAADTVLGENIVNMFARMHPRNMGGARWYINTSVLPQLMRMYFTAGSGGQLVWTPPGGLSVAPYGALLGRPVEALEHCSAIGDVGDILFADWSDYLTIDKGGVEAADSMHVRFIYAERVFRFIWRMNGQPKEPAATTPYKGSNTLSAFVTLAAR